MKAFIYSILLLAPILSFAQKTKDIPVLLPGLINIRGTIYYEDDNKTIRDTLYFMFGRDLTYQHIVEYVPYTMGNFKKMCSVIDRAIEIIETEEKGVSIREFGIKFSVDRLLGVKTLYIYSDDPLERGYTTASKTNLERIKQSLIQYAKKHKIAI